MGNLENFEQNREQLVKAIGYERIAKLNELTTEDETEIAKTIAKDIYTILLNIYGTSISGISILLVSDSGLKAFFSLLLGAFSIGTLMTALKTYEDITNTKKESVSSKETNKNIRANK